MLVVLLVTLPLPSRYQSCDTLVTTAVEAPGGLSCDTTNTSAAEQYC
jgi:hypothetical protein